MWGGGYKNLHTQYLGQIIILYTTELYIPTEELLKFKARLLNCLHRYIADN